MAVRLFSWISCIPLMHSLNSNNRGIHLNYQASREKNHFLDLTISVSGESFITSTYFKPTDRNSFIPNYSCHHASWLRSVPKSQYLRLKRNCTQQSAFLAQAQVLTQRFVDKGYALESLTNTLDQVKCVDRTNLLKENTGGRENDTFHNPFITNFSCQHSSVKHIVKKHWHILKNGRVLKSILPDKPQVVFRGAPSLKDKLAPNILNPPSIRPTFFSELTGYYQCRKCQVCSLNGCKTRRTTSFSSSCKKNKKI